MWERLWRWLSGGSPPQPPEDREPEPFELPLPERPSTKGMQTMGRLWHRGGPGPWQLATDRDDDPIRAIWGRGPSEVYAVGWDNIGVRIWDGQRWRKETTPARRLSGVWGDKRGSVWVAGNTVYERTPEGWVPVRIEGSPSGGFLALWGGDRDGIVYAVGSQGAVLRRGPDGVWRLQQAPTDELLVSVWGLGPDALWAISADGGIYRSSGDGVWKEEHRIEAILGGVWGTREGGMLVVGSGGQILHSTGDGRWTAQSSGTQAQLTGVWGRSAAEVYAFGLQSTLLLSRGRGWRPVPSDYAGEFTAVWGSPGGQDLFLAGERFYME